MPAFLERITLFCFGASYAVALLLELLQMFRPRPVVRVLGLGFGVAGLLAHTLYLGLQTPSPASAPWSMLLVAWILAIFYLYGSIHHSRLAWGVFVLPVVLGLVVLARVFAEPGPAPEGAWLLDWGIVHGVLLVLAAVGVSVAFLASVMYLVQAHRLKAKVLPGQGLRLLSLERLEQMNRRAINLAFPLLTAGLLVGLMLMARSIDQVAGWTDPRVLGTLVLWLVFAILLYLRYGLHLRGRRVALWTIAAFALLLFTLAAPHTLGGGR